MTSTYLVDGVPLDDPAGRWWVSPETGETVPPPLTIASVSSHPSAIGELDAPSPGYGATVWPLVMRVAGPDYAAAKANKTELDRILLGRHRHVTITDDNPVQPRMARGIVTGGDDIKRISFGHRLDVAYPVRIPAGRWFDPDPRTGVCDDATRTAGTVADGTYLLAALLGGSRDMDPIISTVGNGAGTDIRITDVPSGQWVRLAGNITLGAAIVINPLALTATAGGVNVSGLLDFSPRDMYLSPEATVRVQQNGTHTVTVTARRAYA